MIFRKWLRVGIISLLIITPILSTGMAAASGTPSLVISQFKITSGNGQYVLLYNQSAGAIDLSQYELDYINSSNKLSSIAISGQLAGHGYYMLSDDQVRICYQMVLNAVSLGFAATGGSLQVWQSSADKTVKQLQDSVSWASKTTVGAVTLPVQNTANTVSLLRQPTDSAGGLQLNAPSAGSWQAVAPDTADPCKLDVISTATTLPSGGANPGNQLGTGQAPPATVISLASADNAAVAPTLPAADVGLSAPQITELLPNPDGTGTDGTDEYIELYNPNPVEFHLVGFTLQTGTTTKHSYTFPDGTILPPQGFKAFYSADTGLSLSNSSGQAGLLDPFGNLLYQTDPYDTAKDGQAWAFASGVWYWTGQTTPNAANVIKQGVTAKTGSSSAKAKSTAVKGASTAKPAAGPAATDAAAQATPPVPVHPYILAAVAVLAVGYGVYEYRHDLGNRLHQFRRNRAARRNTRPELARR